jgi:chemotaxis protein methyltransferase CheR
MQISLAAGLQRKGRELAAAAGPDCSFRLAAAGRNRRMLRALMPPSSPLLHGVSPDAEFDLAAQDFLRVQKLIHARAGIYLQEGKQAMVYSRLVRRLRETGHRSFAAYLDQLESSSGAAAESEWQEFINCLTTNLTSFFRESHHFDALRADAKALIGRRGQSAGPVRLWCSAASTGEEPYSIAITLAETLGAAGPAWSLLATDIDTKVLGTAQAGVYEATARGLDAAQLSRHFLRGKGPNAGLMRVKPELARGIEFRPFNLMSSHWGALGEPFDIIFCRNVMIYFDAPTQARVLQRMHAQLAPGGLLYVGHSENFSDARALFRLRGKTIYERV